MSNTVLYMTLTKYVNLHNKHFGVCSQMTFLSPKVIFLSTESGALSLMFEAK